MSQPSPDAKAVVRAAEALTTQVRRIADALSTPVVRYEVATDDTQQTPVPCPLCPITVPLSNPEQATAHFRAQHPEQRLVGPGPWPKLATDDGATTPATTCSAQYHGPDNLVPTECIRAAQHVDPRHSDGSGFHWPEAVAVYPTDSTVKVAHWHPVAKQMAEERQELAGMVSEFIDAQMRMARAADEETPSGERRKSLAVLLSRAQRGVTPLTSEESGLLRRHVEAEIREANTAQRRAEAAYQTIDARTAQRDQARGERDRSDEAARLALKQRQEMATERYAIQEQRDTADRIRAEVQRDRDQHAAVLREVLGTFTHETHPGRRCLQSGHINVETVEQWRSVVAPTAERPWWEQVALYEREAVEATRHVLELKAAIERVRHLANPTARTAVGISDYDNGRRDLAAEALAALDDTEQQPTEPGFTEQHANPDIIGTTEGP